MLLLLYPDPLRVTLFSLLLLSLVKATAVVLNPRPLGHGALVPIAGHRQSTLVTNLSAMPHHNTPL